MENTRSCLLVPEKLWSRQEVLSPAHPVPRAAGVYAWYFRSTPPFINTDGCHQHEGLKLLYVGISPSAPPRNGKPPSEQTLSDRIRQHFNGNAKGSTLRLTLGCLLSDQLGIQLRRVGREDRMTFGKGEDRLDEWMGENAFVTWHLSQTPWKIEEELISTLFLPLNIHQNFHNPNHDLVSGIRRRMKSIARELPNLAEDHEPA